jgi:hypothetical protein
MAHSTPGQALQSFNTNCYKITIQLPAQQQAYWGFTLPYFRVVEVKFNLTLSDPMSNLVQHYDFPVPDSFPHVVRTLANR